MKKYINYCTSEQTLRAYKLGAPIEKRFDMDITPSVGIEEDNKFFWLVTPTTQQMINWLRDKGIEITIDCATSNLHFIVWAKTENIIIQSVRGDDYKLAELGAIDGAINYLEKNEK